MKHHTRIKIRNNLRNAGLTILSICLLAGTTGQLGWFGDVTSFSHFLTNTTSYPVQPRHIYVLLSVTAGAGISLFVGSLFIPLRSSPKGSLNARRANSTEDLRLLYNFLGDYAGARLVPLDKRAEMMKKNSDCFWMIEEHRFDGAMRTVGVLMIFLLNRRASDSVQRGELTGFDIRAEHLVAKRGKPSGCYIGFLWAIDGNKPFKPYSGEVIRVARDILLRAIRNVPEPVIFARPTTRHALAAAKRFGFKPLNSASGGPLKLDQVAFLQGTLLRLPR